MPSRSLAYLALSLSTVLALGAASCGEAPTSPAMQPDAGPPPGGGGIGDPCTRTDPTCQHGSTQGTCSTGLVCLATCGSTAVTYMNGYCAQPCPGGKTCPAGTACEALPTDGSFQCLKTCKMDSDCRHGEGYSCLNLADDGTLVCYPYTPMGGTYQGQACVPLPSSGPPSAGFGTPNQPVPSGPMDVITSEGNDAADGLGHVITSFIGESVHGTSEIGVAQWIDASAGGTGFASTPQLFQTRYSPGFLSDPVVTFDAKATPPRAFLVYLDIMGSPGAPGADVPLVARSDGAGAPGSWSTPSNIAPGEGGFLDKPWIVASGGQVIATYSVNTHDIHVVRSTDGGLTWKTPISAGGCSGGCNLATPALDDAGDLWVAWWDGGGAIYLSEQPAGAASFGTPVDVSKGHTPGFDDPSIAVSGDGGTLWIAWSEGDAATGTNLWAEVSHDGGATFLAPVQVNDDASPKTPAPCATHFLPLLALDATGRAHIIWDDNRYLYGTVMYAHSLSDSAFSANAAVNDTTFPFTTSRSQENWLGDYIGLAADGKNLYATWADPRSGISHMYFAERSLP